MYLIAPANSKQKRRTATAAQIKNPIVNPDINIDLIDAANRPSVANITDTITPQTKILPTSRKYFTFPPFCHFYLSIWRLPIIKFQKLVPEVDTTSHPYSRLHELPPNQ
ncbi:MAG TPA: hypothetical protein PLI45_04335 [Candidatus Woesebacteria bacterium]|nr:hypothetical protein [Candidatus Woesebacteria bacterium]